MFSSSSLRVSEVTIIDNVAIITLLIRSIIKTSWLCKDELVWINKAKDYTFTLLAKIQLLKGIQYNTFYDPLWFIVLEKICYLEQFWFSQWCWSLSLENCIYFDNFLTIVNNKNGLCKRKKKRKHDHKWKNSVANVGIFLCSFFQSANCSNFSVLTKNILFPVKQDKLL